MSTVGRRMTTFMTLPIVGAGVAALKMSNNFHQGMANVNSIMKVSQQELGTYSDQVRKLATKFPQDATTLADGLYQVASGGFQGAEAMKVLTASAAAASAGMTDTDVASKAIIASLKGYGRGAQDAGKISDILFRGVDKGILTFEELAGSMGDYVGLASQLKVPLQDVVGAQAAMTLSGVSASEAATSMNAVLRSLIKPSKDMTEQLKAFGVEGGQAALETFGLQGIIQKLSAAVGEDKQAWLKFFPEIRGARGAMALASGEGKNFNDVMEAMATRAGATGRALQEQAKGPAFQMKIAINVMKDAVIDFGEVLLPLAKKIAGWGTSIAKAFSDLTPKQKNFAVTLLAIAAAAGPVLFILGKLITVVLGLGRAFVFLGGARTAATAIQGVGVAGGAAATKLGGFLGLLRGVGVAGGLAAVANGFLTVMKNASLFNTEMDKIRAGTISVTGGLWTIDKEIRRIDARGGFMGFIEKGTQGFLDMMPVLDGIHDKYREFANEAIREGVAATREQTAEWEKFLGVAGRPIAFGSLNDFIATLAGSRHVTQAAGDEIIAMIQQIRGLGGTFGQANLEQLRLFVNTGNLTAVQMVLTAQVERQRKAFQKRSKEFEKVGLEAAHFKKSAQGSAEWAKVQENANKRMKDWVALLVAAPKLNEVQRTSLARGIAVTEKYGVRLKGMSLDIFRAAIATGDYATAQKILAGQLELVSGKSKKGGEAVRDLINTINALKPPPPIVPRVNTGPAFDALDKLQDRFRENKFEIENAPPPKVVPEVDTRAGRAELTGWREAIKGVPSKVPTAFTADVAEALGKLAVLQGRYREAKNAIEGNIVVDVDAETRAGRAKLQSFGAAVREVPDNAKVTVTALTSTALARLEGFVGRYRAIKAEIEHTIDLVLTTRSAHRQLRRFVDDYQAAKANVGREIVIPPIRFTHAITPFGTFILSLVDPVESLTGALAKLGAEQARIAMNTDVMTEALGGFRETTESGIEKMKERLANFRTANRELEKAQKGLNAARARGSKEDIEAAKQEVKAAERRIAALKKHGLSVKQATKNLERMKHVLVDVAAVEVQMGQFDAMSAQLDALKGDLDALKAKAEAFGDAVSSGFRQAFDFIGKFGSETGSVISVLDRAGKVISEHVVGAADLTKFLKDSIEQAKDWAAVLLELRRQGLSTAVLQQLAAAGPGAMPLANAILAAGVGEINALQAELEGIIQSTVQTLQQGIFGQAVAELESQVITFSNALQALIDAINVKLAAIGAAVAAATGGGGGTAGGAEPAGAAGGFHLHHGRKHVHDPQGGHLHHGRKHRHLTTAATGGVVTMAGLAELHRGEVIVKTGAMAAGAAGGRTTNNYFDVHVPPPQKALIDEAELVTMLRRLGLFGG